MSPAFPSFLLPDYVGTGEWGDARHQFPACAPTSSREYWGVIVAKAGL